MIMSEKYQKAKSQETTFKINDKVRHSMNLSIFEKQGQSKWSPEIYTVTDKLKHSYKLSNGKWYRYWQLQKIRETESIKKVGRPTKHSTQSLKQSNTINRRLRHEDVNIKNIVKEKRTRQKTDRFSY